MPRITETLTKDIQTAADHFDHQEDRLGGIFLEMVRTRALVEIADSLKGIQTALEPIGQIFAEAKEVPLKLETPIDITPMEKAIAAAEASKPKTKKGS